MCLGFWLEKLNERDYLENACMKESIIFKLILKKYDEGNGMFIRGRKTTRLLCCIKVPDFFKFQRMHAIYCLAEEPVASNKKLCSIQCKSLVQKDIRGMYVYFSPL